MLHVVSQGALDLTGIIRPTDGVLWGQACAEPQTLVEAFVAQRAAYSGASAFLGINHAGIVRPEHADHLRLTAYCGAGHNRALADAGALRILPVAYSQIASLIRTRRIRVDVLLLQLSPPNARGEYSLGIAADYLIPALEVARVVVAEVNDRVPWTRTERLLYAGDLTLAMHTSRDPAEVRYPAPGEVGQRIATHAAAYVPDGATLETGLGALPDAVLHALGDHRDLGVHSGALGDGIVELMRRGVINNARKALEPGQTVGGMLLGTRALFEFARDNFALHLRSSEHTHNPHVLAQIPSFVAINSAVEVDLTGQVNAEIAGGSYVGAVGGAPDFVRAANHSPGGVSLVVLPSSVGTRASRIVAELSGPVATARADAGVFVTEHGAADLRGLTIGERVPRMLAIAHPAFREALERAARKAGLLRA